MIPYAFVGIFMGAYTLLRINRLKEIRGGVGHRLLTVVICGVIWPITLFMELKRIIITGKLL